MERSTAVYNHIIVSPIAGSMGAEIQGADLANLVNEAALTAGCYTHTTRVPFLVPDACPLERVLELLQLTLVATYALADAMHTFRFF